MRFFFTAAMTIVLLLSSVCVFAAQPNSSPAKETSSKATKNAVIEDKEREGKPVPEPAIAIGSKGDEVVRVQGLLAKFGFYAGDIDGIFGNCTQQAVRDFQAVYSLPVNGVVNRETFAYMERASADPSRSNRSLIMTASAYTAYDDGCGGITYRGNTLRRGLVAVDPNVIPLGTRLYIPGYGFAIADDIGGAIRGNRIDLAFESRSEAFQFGVRRITVYIFD